MRALKDAGTRVSTMQSSMSFVPSAAIVVRFMIDSRKQITIFCFSLIRYLAFPIFVLLSQSDQTRGRPSYHDHVYSLAMPNSLPCQKAWTLPRAFRILLPTMKILQDRCSPSTIKKLHPRLIVSLLLQIQ